MQHKLQQLAEICSRTGSNIVYDLNLQSWSEEDIQEFEQANILLFRGYSGHTVCGGCHKKCFVSPKIIKYPDGISKGVIICTDPDNYGRIEFDTESLRYWEINKDKLPQSKSKPAKKKQVKRSRATQKELEDRNRAVAMASAKFTSEHDRLPTVTDIVTITSYERQQIYSTEAYKEGKIIKASAKATNELTGSSATETEYFDEKSINHSRAKRRSKTEQAMLDSLIEQQAEDNKSNYVL